MDKIRVTPLGWFARLGDRLMVPVMFCLAGTFAESPQQTHVWNNLKLRPHQLRYLISGFMVRESGIGFGKVRWFLLPLFHMPIFGGWRKYVVLRAESNTVWHVGWLGSDNGGGVSRIPLTGDVRMTIGPGDVQFFGVTPDGFQIKINKIGEGFIGKGGPFAKIPLL